MNRTTTATGSGQGSSPAMRRMVWVLAILLAILHQDLWWWDDGTLVFGFMPVGLFYHALFSLAAGGVWALAVKFAWPTHLEEWADEFDEQAPGQSGGDAS